eukprot:TRINITY_DN26803_c0_g3_i1.p1 TRINITY_DN26803_c0_g3~~TRINITY_DN26803_c0_g3_i1.p1  ORF type:complete len:1351 (-),score=174.93 TRINITY_DN26803_c0_g3_i1:204-4199(-)
MDAALLDREVGITEEDAGRSPEAAAGLWSRLTFGWLGTVISEGYRREQRRQRAVDQAGCDRQVLTLTERDLLALRPDDQPDHLRELGEAAWAAEASRPEGDRSLRRALRVAFGKPFFAAAGFKFVYDSLQMVGPYVLRHFLDYLLSCEKLSRENVACSAEEGIKWMSVIVVSSLVQTAVLHQYFHLAFRTGMRLNAASICLIYEKSLRISGPGTRSDVRSSRESPQTQVPQMQRTTGEIVNLMSVDAQRIQDTMTYLHTLWSGPYQIIITLCFLFAVVRWATLAGLAVMLLQVPLVSFLSTRVKKAQRALMEVKDERVKMTNEVFSSVRLLKMYSWEDSFEKCINDIREKELRFLRRYQLLNIISSAMWSVAPILTGVATFAVYTTCYGTLSAGTAFSALALFNVLRFPLTMFPNMVTSAVEAGVAIDRIQDFLLSPEVKGRSTEEGANPAQGAALVRLEDATFHWSGGVPLLKNMSFVVPAPLPGQTRAHLTVVIGSVGVGKSGLLQALIGDLSPIVGSSFVAGKVAYTSQVAWIRNATLKDNILFNQPFDKDRYDAVMKACQLLPDLDALPNGDATEIGEKGVNLSGGQKQRVSLARAIYANADLLLLDDPLSAVDAEVAKKLMTMLTGPLVRSSSIVLCTHYLSSIRHADQVILLEQGSLAFCGSKADFCLKHPDIAVHAEEKMDRQESADASAVEVEKKQKSDAGRTVEAEIEHQGAVSWKVYKTYVDAAGGLPLAIMVIVGLMFGQACQTGADTWISFWADHSKQDHRSTYISSKLGMCGYVMTSFAAFFGILCTSSLFRLTALRAARSFHKQLLAKLLTLPMSFYDTTPLGRVLNRFSKDIYVVDEVLVSILMSYSQTLCRVLATLCVITCATPWFLCIVVPLMLIYRYIQNYYVPSSRQLKRIESNLRSPIFSLFSETLDGVATIRAYCQERQFLCDVLNRLQRNERAYYLSVASNRWLAIRLETIGTAIVAAAGFLAVFARNTISAGVAGLSISYALSVTQSLNWVVRMTSDRETNVVSVERLREYICKRSEPPLWQPEDPPKETWPLEGAIVFEDVHLQYREGLPFVLCGLDLRVEPGEKLGICGRTGAGKSSLLNVILRIVDVQRGSICIDDVNIATVGLRRLRRSLTVLPQDPVLFSGSLRFNLDPLAECSDAIIWRALQRSHLARHAQALALASASGSGSGDGDVEPETAGSPSIAACLDTIVAEKGENFSLGQRQQACLARALLRSNRILLLDEATSAVDMETDGLIQETIRTEFADHTILCIAHRISTVMASDRVCVVEGGRVLELGPPRELLKKQGSRFARLAEHDDATSRQERQA